MTKKVFFIVGEPSGDALGASLIRALKAETNNEIEYIGIGGPLMEEEGFESLLPMDEICIMGLVEVILQLPRLLRLISGIVEEIEEADPDVVVTIDLPDFNFEVGSRLKKRAQSRAKIVHYVAPSVWAWRENRAQKISGFLDGLLCLFPFEPKYFEKHELPSPFIGHPMIENKVDEDAGEKFRKEFHIQNDETVLGLFFGSRLRELYTLSSTLKETVDILVEQYPKLVVVVPTLPQLEFDVRGVIADWGVNPIIVPDAEKKWGAMAACDIALAVSGTVGLELSYMKVPHVIGYKMNPLSWMAVKFLVKVKYAHLTNILLDRKVILECLQKDFTSKKLSKGILTLIKFDKARTEQMDAFDDVRTLMHAGSEVAPSSKAAKFILKYIGY